MNYRLSTILLSLAVTPLALGQYDDLQFRFGSAFSLNQNTRQTAREFFSVGLLYKLKTLEPSETAARSLHVSIDFQNRPNYRHVPVMINYVVEPKNSANFYSFGGGMGFVRQPDGTGTESVGRIAYSAGLGRFFHPDRKSFGEIRFFGSGASSLNTIALLAGFKF